MDLWHIGVDVGAGSGIFRVRVFNAAMTTPKRRSRLVPILVVLGLSPILALGALVVARVFFVEMFASRPAA